MLVHCESAWPSLQLQSMQLMSHMSSIGRPRGWTPMLPPEMLTWVMAHQVGDHHDEQGWRQLTTSLQSPSQLPTQTTHTTLDHARYCPFISCILSPIVTSPSYAFCLPPATIYSFFITHAFQLSNSDWGSTLRLMDYKHTHTQPPVVPPRSFLLCPSPHCFVYI